MVWIGYVVAFMVGGLLGMLIGALMCAAKGS